MGEFAGVLSGHLNARAGPFWAPWRARLGHCAPAPNSVVASDLDRAKAKTPPELPGGVACADGWFEARRKPRCRAKDPREELGAVLNGTGRSNLVILRQLFAMLRQVGRPRRSPNAFSTSPPKADRIVAPARQSELVTPSRGMISRLARAERGLILDRWQLWLRSARLR